MLRLKKLNRLFITIAFIGLYISGFPQGAYRIELCQKVIKKNMLNTTLSIKRQEKDFGIVKYEVKYLGMTKYKPEYRIITVSVFTGVGNHSKNEIYIFSRDTVYLGRYRGFLYFELPRRLYGDTLVFGKSKNCEMKQKSTVVFKSNLPKSIEISCRGEEYETYSFYPAKD